MHSATAAEYKIENNCPFNHVLWFPWTKLVSLITSIWLHLADTYDRFWESTPNEKTPAN
jgi:hypothetical protein